MHDDRFMFILGAGALLVGVYLYASGNFGADGGDGGDTTAATGSGDAMTQDDVYSLAQQVLADMQISDITPEMATTIASIESTFNPSASRQEPQINDASYGLMQVLVGTAKWMSGSGWDASTPDAETLSTPAGSMYFGCAYLHYLRNYKGSVRPDSFVVAAYNGGPGGASKAGPQNYLASYTQRTSDLGYA